MLPRPFSDFATPQSNVSPVPPRAFSLYASRRNRSASNLSTSARSSALRTLMAFITGRPPARTAATVSGVSPARGAAAARLAARPGRPRPGPPAGPARGPRLGRLVAVELGHVQARLGGGPQHLLGRGVNED